MSKVEEKALEIYPKKETISYGPLPGADEPCVFDDNLPYRIGFIKGYEKAEQDLGWHDVKESLPPMDEEVIVLRSFICADGTEIDGPYQISFGHIVDTERCIDYNGWNVPGVKFWMPIPELPKK